jgi:hypothetical protein
MFGEPENCPVCTSRIPDHCRDKAEGIEAGRRTKTFRIYCPACDVAFEHTYADQGLGAYTLLGCRRLDEGDHELGHLRLKHEAMSDRPYALVSA